MHQGLILMKYLHWQQMPVSKGWVPSYHRYKQTVDYTLYFKLFSRFQQQKQTMQLQTWLWAIILGTSHNVTIITDFRQQCLL